MFQRFIFACLVAIVLSAPSSRAQGGASWQRQSPLPYPPQLNPQSIAFSGSRGFLVGANTGLLETTDGGITWHERVLTGPLLNEGGYRRVVFADALHGWLVGQKVSWTNACFRTVDGGVTWTQMSSISNSDWSQLDFVTPTHGWAGAPGILQVTNDGGATWTTQNYGSNVRIDAMDFVDGNVGVLSTAGTLRRTQNGGQTWTVVHGHESFAIEWVNATTVLASTHSFGGPDFARSTDAGLTWQTIDLPGVDLQNPVRVDATTVIAGTPDADLYRSTDAGATWQQVWSSGLAANMNGGKFTSATDGFVLVAGNVILRTLDAGLTWFHASNGFAMEFEDEKMFDARRGLVCGGGGTILRTEDAGRTWIPTRPGWTLSGGSPLIDLSLVAPSFAFASGDHGTLVKTLDAGLTWQAVAAPTGYPNGGTGNYSACSFVSPTEGWMAGQYLEITHTTDGGATWNQQFVGGSSADGVYDMDFVDAQNGWIVGTFGGVLRTVDGGSTWVFFAFPGNGPDARAVDFANTLVGWAASIHGWIARTTNGGVTWTQQSIPGVGFGTHLESIQVISPTECWAASVSGGRVFHTTNGGSSWTELVTPFHDDYDGYTGIAVTPNGDVWVAGSGGVISHYGSVPSAVSDTCVGDGSGASCPCGNASPVGAGQGCANSLGFGARLAATGTPRILSDTLVLSGTNMPDSSALYFQGTQALSFGVGAVFGDGLRCTGGSVIRLATVSNTGGGSQYPTASSPSIHQRGLVATPGLRVYQVWYRNAAPFCTPSTFNLTNGLAVSWSL